MPRRSNTSNENARRRRQTRINVMAGNRGLLNTIRNASRILNSEHASAFEKNQAKGRIMSEAIRVFTIQRKLNALPRTRSKIVEKMLNAWPHAMILAMVPSARAPRTAEVQPSVSIAKIMSARVSPYRNLALARTARGSPVVVYVPFNRGM